MMKDTWTIGPFSKFSFKEKAELRKALKAEVDRYQAIANENFSESKNTSLMLGKEEFDIRNDVMRRNMV